MVQIDVSLAAGVGATLAASASAQLRQVPSLWRNGYLATSLAFTAFFLTPVTLYFLHGWTAWDTMYRWDRQTLPAWLPPLFVVVCLASAQLGFVAVHAAARAGKLKLALALPGLFFIPAVLVTVAGHDRFLHVGTLESYRAGAVVNLFESTLLWPLLWVNGVFVCAPMALIGYRWAKAGLLQGGLS